MDICGDNEDMATSESDESSVGTNVSRLITEEDLIDSLFYTCNIGATDTVSVSKLIDYLRSTTGNLSESVIDTRALDELRQYLDPAKDDISIDLDTYRAGISCWIHDLRIQELCDSNSESNDLCDSESESVFTETGLVISPASENPSDRMSLAMTLGSLNSHRPGTRSTSTASQQTIISNMTNTPSSLNDSSTTHKMKDDEIEMLNTIAELEFQNKKLVEDNTNLRKQLESSEETVTQIAQQLEELQITKKSHHSTKDRLKELRMENEELKMLVSSCEDTKNIFKRQLNDVRKDVMEVEKENLEYQTLISNIKSRLETSTAEKEELHNSLSHYKLLQEKSQQITDSLESQLNQKDAEVAEYKKLIEEQKLMNEGLRNEKSELEIQLFGSKYDILSKQSGNLTPGFRPHINHLLDDDLMPVKLSPKATSTPCKSLCNELRTTILLDEAALPSPLCDKEVEEIYRTAMSTSMVPERDTDAFQSSAEIQNVIDAAMSSSVNLGKLAEKSTHIANQLKEKKESMMLDLRNVSQGRKADAMLHMGTDLLKEKLNQEVSQYADKIASLWMEKKCLEKRVFKLMEALKNLQEHNQSIEQKNEEALKEIEQESQRLNSYLKENLTRIQQQLSEERSQCQVYKKMAEEANDSILDLKEKLFDLDVKWKCTLEENKTLAEECDNLKRSNLEISEQYEKVGAQMTDLKDELGQASAIVDKEKEKNSRLEGSLCNAQLQRQMDMKDIWRLVHSDVEKECLTDSQELLDTPITVSADSLRDQVAKEIYSLRSQLARSQKALESLVQTRGLPLNSYNRNTDSDLRNNNDHGGSSPLVEALMLDTFGEADRNSRSGRPVQGTSSADDILDGHDPKETEFDRNYNLRHGADSSSCPHLAGKFVTSGTQTEKDSAYKTKRRAPQIGTSQYNVVNTSTGSSTSGVDVGSNSSRSDLLHPFRKGVIIVDIIQDSPSSPDDPDNPQYRYRSSSFKKAIERGPSGESSIFESFETCEPASTSSDISPDHSDPPPYADLGHRPGKLVGGQARVASPYVTVRHQIIPKLKEPSFEPCERGHSNLHREEQGKICQKQRQTDFSQRPKQKDSSEKQLATKPSVFEQRAEHSHIMDQCKETTKTTRGEKQHSEPDLPVQVLAVDDDDESPGRNRRLSTLVEEASDAEADESLSYSGRNSRSPRSSTSGPKSPRTTAIGPKSPKLLTSTTPHPPPYKKVVTSDQDSSNTQLNSTVGDSQGVKAPRSSPRQDQPLSSMPPYKEPPAYKAATACCRVSSPYPGLVTKETQFRDGTQSLPGMVPDRSKLTGSQAGAGSQPVTGSSSSYLGGNTMMVGHVTLLSPETEPTMKRSWSEPPSLQGALSGEHKPHNTLDNVPRRSHSEEREGESVSTQGIKGLEGVRWTYTPPSNPNYKAKKQGENTEVKEQNDTGEEQKNVSCTSEGPSSEPRQQLSAVRDRRKILLEKSKSGSESGQLVSPVNGELEDVELSEADKLFNCQMLEEASKKTNVARQKLRRSKKGSGSDLARSQSIDEGGPDDEVFEKNPSPDQEESCKLIKNSIISEEEINSTAVVESASVSQAGQRLQTLETASAKNVKTESTIDGKEPAAKEPAAGSSSPKPFKITSNLQLGQAKEESTAKTKAIALIKQTKMQDVTETSETESVKGSGGSLDSAESDMAHVDRSKQGTASSETSQQAAVFPCLPDSVLAKLGVKAKPGCTALSSEHFSEQEVEEKFASLALAFKTDKLTLNKRIELHQRARDITEQNVERELEGLKEAMKALSQYCSSSSSREVYKKLQHHVEVLEQTTSRVSSRAEVHGAVQQELRISQAIDVMVVHVENLKRMYEKEHTELEETRKLLHENKGGSSGDGTRFSLSSAGGAKRLLKHWMSSKTDDGGRRRASVAVFSKGLGGLGSSNPTTDMQDPKSRLQSLFGDSNMAAVVRRASTVATPLRRLSLFSVTSPPDLTTQLTELPVAPVTRKRSTSDSGNKAAPIILEEDEDADANDTGLGKVDPSGKPLKGEKKSQNVDETESNQQITTVNLTDPLAKVDGNSNLKKEIVSVEVPGIVIGDSVSRYRKDDLHSAAIPTGNGSDSDEEFQDHLRQYLEDYLPEDDLDAPYESIFEQMYKAWPGWEQVLLRLRYTVAGVIFLMGILSLILTILPGASASQRGRVDIWEALERKLAPYLMVKHHRPPPT